MSRPVLKLGARGAAVRELTQRLVERGFLARPTSDFDGTVRSAVVNFQAHGIDARGHALVADGIVGPVTWWALTSDETPRSMTNAVEGPLTRVPASGGSGRGRAALRAALVEMASGAREEGRDNDGRWVRKYLNGVVAPPANWCAGFVSWCFAQHTDGVPFRYSVGARDIRDQFRRKGWAYDLGSGTSPEPGDVIVWWRGQPEGWMGHIGLVHHAADGIVYTIEGNKGSYPARVRPLDYVLSRIDKLLGFGRVRSDPKSSPTP